MILFDCIVSQLNKTGLLKTLTLKEFEQEPIPFIQELSKVHLLNIVHLSMLPSRDGE